MKKLFELFQKIDSRWIYLVLSVFIIIPIFLDCQSKVKPSKPVVSLYNFIDDMEKDDTILLSFSYSPDSLAELNPMGEAIVYHALKKGVRVMGIALVWPEGGGLGLGVIKSQVDHYNQEILVDYIDRVVDHEGLKDYFASYKVEDIRKDITSVIVAVFERDTEILDQKSELRVKLDQFNLLSDIPRFKDELKLIGRDWVHFGYNPGYVSIVLGMGTDIPSTIGGDYKGKDLGMYEMFSTASKRIKNYDDVSLVIDFAAGGSLGIWVTYVNTKFGRPVATGVTAVMAADYYPYLQSGQIIGLLNGMRGAADYEELIKKYGTGTSGMASQTGAHLLIIILIILGNIGYLVSKKGGEK